MVCKYQGRKKCVEEAIEVVDLYSQLSEVPFRSCPKESSEFVSPQTKDYLEEGVF
eukprot:NODE_4276_length_679_cov_10.163492_g3639_i0.p5 GENE.NODE_4276_length_679_cov_10.163492_g3639_i0~~NODE_4276_length_679_cov_10.163492_g3639_i0.p5  ORF type:complete len:55 (-),score=9.27 NODE_4276_length_679_cov_10.163492_g3639_i0:307-471(-)